MRWWRNWRYGHLHPRAPSLWSKGGWRWQSARRVKHGRRCWRRELTTARPLGRLSPRCGAKLARRARAGHGVLECAMREWRRFLPLASQLDDALLSMDNLLGPTPKSARRGGQ